MSAVDLLRGGLVVSTQAPRGSPLANPVVIAAIAAAAEAAGCAGHRIDTPEHVAAVRAACRRPILGIYKVETLGCEVYITPTVEAARAVARVGADLIAVDGTARPRPDGLSLGELIRRIKWELGLPVMADVATLAEGVAAARLGADVVATTLSGYTAETAHLREQGPDLALVRDLVAAVDVPVAAEGRYHRPEQVAAALAAGALFVVVGTAITAPGWLTRQFVQATRPAL